MKDSHSHLGKLLFSIGASLALGATACGQKQPSISIHPVPIHMITSPGGGYSGASWLKDDWLVFSYEPVPDIKKVPFPLWRMRPDGSQMVILPLPKDEQHCRLTHFFYHQGLQDGRLAFLRDCIRFMPEGGIDSHDTRLMIWDPQEQVSLLWRSYELPTHVATFALAPDLSRALFATNSRISDEMFWLDEDEARALDINFARARMPAWSPDGNSIVFFGNREISGEPGPSWIDVPHDLWIMPANCEILPEGCDSSLQMLVKGILYPSGVDWSPDADWIAFDGNLQGRGYGIWLLHMESGEIIQVLSGEPEVYGVPDWSPDGKRLVVVGPPEGGKQDIFDLRSALYTLDVSEIVGN